MNTSTTPDNRPVIRQIIAAIGPGWTAKPTGNSDEPNSSYNKTHMIAQNGDMTLFIEAPEKWRGKPEPYQIAASYPTYANKSHAVHTGEALSINVGRMKGPAQVASDIRRRLLPEYTEILKRVIERGRMQD